MGRGGEYFYFFCTGRKVGKCNLPYVRVEAIEAEVLKQYHGVRISAESEQEFRDVLKWSMVELQSRRAATRDRLQRELVATRAREDRLLDLASENDDLPRSTIRERLGKLSKERTDIEAQLARPDNMDEIGAEVLLAAHQLLTGPAAAYAAGDDFVRLSPDEPSCVRQASGSGRRVYQR